MSVLKNLVVAPVAAMLLVSPVLAATDERPAVLQLPTAASTKPAPLAVGTRLGNRIKKKNGLLGTPLLLMALGGTAATIGTIEATNGGGSPSSPTAS